MSVGSGKIYAQRKGSNMGTVTVKQRTYQLGDLFTTLSSGTTGTIQEIIPNSSGSVRVRLDVEGKERWTTISPDQLGN